MRRRRRKTGSIGRTSRLAIVGFAAAVSLWGISACSGFWSTPPQLAKLLVSDVTVTGARGTVLISVADMPETGAASIQFGTVEDPAIRFTNIDAATITIGGENGFVVLASDVATTAGKGTLLAANASTGMVSGEVLRFTFTVIAANPTFTVDETEVTIGSGSNALIAAWGMSTKDYYSK